MLEEFDSSSDTASSCRAEYVSQNALALLGRSDDALFVSGTQGIFFLSAEKEALIVHGAIDQTGVYRRHGNGPIAGGDSSG
jgi:hypothetical protein